MMQTSASSAAWLLTKIVFETRYAQAEIKVYTFISQSRSERETQNDGAVCKCYYMLTVYAWLLCVNYFI